MNVQIQKCNLIMISSGVIKVQCDACKEVISGKYIHYSDGSIFCVECYKYLLKCIHCKKPIVGGEEQSIDGLCQLCYQRAPKCDICEKAIISSYSRFIDGTIACDSCVKKYLKCERCGKPVVKYTKIRGKILCKFCLTDAPRCSVCNNPIVGIFWIFGSNNVCDYCYKIYERVNCVDYQANFSLQYMTEKYVIIAKKKL